jgi:thiol:disulfide interchange protein DsbC
VAADDVHARVAERIKQLDSRLNVESVADAPLKGLYEVVLDSGEVLYTDDSGEYVLAGQLYQIVAGQGFVNLTEQRMQQIRVDMLAKIPAEERVIFPADGEMKARLQVFTDVDCVYCRRLHQEVDELNGMGIQVEYLAFPRGGANSAAAGKMSAIWCAEGDERRELMSRAKSGEALSAADCDNPVLDQFRLGQRLGVTGTPALVLEDGRLLPGYVPAQRLATMLGL